ncbi:hypothetical protein FRC16_003776 [Serendipita sp. 398]|nr:hypothetical protein FRC16_003776 [Serendipita sp. 398]
MDEELGANLSLAISSAQKTQESCMALLSVSPPTSLRSPSDDMSSIGSIPRTPIRPRVSQSEYPHQHILPPAEILRLERVGFTAQDQAGRRGRDPSLSLSPISPLSTSSLNPLADWSRGSTNTSRTDIIPSSTSPRTRPYRSGSLATMSSSSSTLLNAHSPIRESPLASRSFAALPRPVDAVSQRRPSNASSLTPTRRPTSARSVTTPSSPVTGHSALSPPPRPRIRSLKSGNDLKGAMGDPEPESTESHFTALSPPPPRSSRRPSTASSSTSITQRQSILRKPSFLDIEDDDGRPSLEEATVASAPGLGSDSYPTSSLTPSPSIRTLNALGGGRSSSSLSISTTSRQVSANPSDDSFLDMGKISLETIRSESSDTHAFQDLEPSPLQQRTTYIESLPYRSRLGSHYQRGDIIGSNY